MSSKVLAAQNFTMPALSPTMTEGNISSWKVKEGDSFAAGDILLEIETDKASMDVEAPDDGIMFKILQGDGSKQIKVGTRIGVLAEPDDDLSSLQVPADEAGYKPSQNTKSDQPDSKKSSPSQEEAPPTSKPEDSKPTSIDTKSEGRKKAASAPTQTYPLLPSVEYLIHKNNLSNSDVDKMTPSGPNNRLLKGDVLAYLGSIKSAYPAELATKLSKLTHLDLSNIKIAPQKQVPVKKDAVTEIVKPAQPSKVAVTVSMLSVIDVQKRIQSTLGVFIPLSTFIARATDLANEDLPRFKSSAATSDELFNSILGLHAVSTNAARGHYTPQVLAFSTSSAVSTLQKTRASASKSDILDILIGEKQPSSKKARPVTSSGLMTGTNIFSVSVSQGREKQARVFLERVKTVLEVEPGSLVL